MRCLYAFLLIPQDGLKNTKRLAIMYTDLHGSHYHIFKPKANQFFPIVDSRTDIKMTDFYINGPGTYPRAYCSDTLQSLELISHVTRSLESVLDKSHEGFGDSDQAAESCLGVLKTLSLQEKGVTHITPNDVRPSGERRTPILGSSSNQPPKIRLSNIRRMTGCSDFGLISLAYQKRIKVTDDDSHFAPDHSEGQFKVDFDVNMDIYNIVLKGQMFAEINHQNDYYVLAWYMGYLHMFKKKESDSQWLPETPIGYEREIKHWVSNIIDRHWNEFYGMPQIIYEKEDHDRTASCFNLDSFLKSKPRQQVKCTTNALFEDMRLNRFPAAN